MCPNCGTGLVNALDITEWSIVYGCQSCDWVYSEALDPYVEVIRSPYLC